MKKKIIIISAIIAGAVVARFIFSLYGQIMTGKMMAKTSAPEVVLDEIQTADVLKQVEAPGRIVSKYRIDVLARIDGYLTKSYFKEGDYVKKGQVLFEIEPEEWYLAVKKARANVAGIKAQLVYAEKQLKRGEELVKQDYIAKAAYDNLLSQRDALSAQLALNQAELNDASRNYGYTKVKAPVDGQVGMITVTVGNYVNPAAGALTTIYSNNPIYVTFPLDSKDYDRLVKIDTQNVTRKTDLFFPTGEKYEFQGNQDFYDNKIDETTGTVTMRATFENPKLRLLNGDFVKVIVYSKNTVNVPIVPQTAVLENPQGKYVYAVDDKNIAHIVQIKVSGQYKENWIVDEGLKKGDMIVVDGIQRVIPDRAVKIIDKAAMEKIKQHEPSEEAKK